MAKSADAFRTISEVADWLGSPAHVLRFWESKFSQVKPVKRAGGRRYYRPADMQLLGGIKKLLHDDGMTIKGVQKILREQGVKYVASLSQPLEFDAGDAIESTAREVKEAAKDIEEGTVVQFQRTDEPVKAQPAEAQALDMAAEDVPDRPPVEGAPASDTRVFEDFAASGSGEAETEATAEPELQAEPDEEPALDLPAFLHRDTLVAKDAAEDTVEDVETEAAAEPEPESTPEPEPEPLRPAQVDVPPDPQDSEITAAPGVLAALAARKGRALPPAALAEAAALRDRLAAIHARFGETRPD